MPAFNATLLVLSGVAHNATNATWLDNLVDRVDRVAAALDARSDVVIIVLASVLVLLGVLLIVLVYCCCFPKVTVFYWFECWCRRLCCLRPLAEQEEIARGPDQAIEEHQDEDAEVDSIDEPVRRTPPVTDGEDEDEEPPPSPSRACCTAVADALATSHEQVDEEPTAPAAAPKPSTKAQGKRVAGKSVAFKKD